jgi:hypothetical protein
MMFHTPEGETRGDSGGAAFGDGPIPVATPDPHFLFAGGFEFSDVSIETEPLPETGEKITCPVPNPDHPADDGGVWVLGRYGTQGSFLQEFSYETGSAAGPLQRGAGCVYRNGNKLTGELAFEEQGKYQVDLTYSTENSRATSVSDFGSTGVGKAGIDTIEYHMWDNDNIGTEMSYSVLNVATSTGTAELAVVEESATADCNGTIKATEVANHNLFTLETIGTLSDGCNVLLNPVVNLDYDGLGAIVDFDGDGTLEFVHLMRSTSGGAGFTAQALYNQFILQ